MLTWSILFFVLSVIAGLLGFGGIAVASSGVAQVLFYIFIILFLFSLVTGISRRGDRFVNKHL